MVGWTPLLLLLLVWNWRAVVWFEVGIFFDALRFWDEELFLWLLPCAVEGPAYVVVELGCVLNELRFVIPMAFLDDRLPPCVMF